MRLNNYGANDQIFFKEFAQNLCKQFSLGSAVIFIVLTVSPLKIAK